MLTKKPRFQKGVGVLEVTFRGSFYHRVRQKKNSADAFSKPGNSCGFVVRRDEGEIRMFCKDYPPIRKPPALPWSPSR